jgi:hypothetical protein
VDYFNIKTRFVIFKITVRIVTTVVKELNDILSAIHEKEMLQ